MTAALVIALIVGLLLSARGLLGGLLLAVVALVGLAVRALT